MASSTSKIQKYILSVFWIANIPKAANFLNKMAFEIDSDAPAEGLEKGAVKVDGKPPMFKPLRRKWQSSE